MAASSTAEAAEVSRFRSYLRINTMQPTPDYAASTVFLEQQAAEIGLQHRRHECVAGKPIVIMTLPGEQPQLPSILLNSHVDVVPVFMDSWKYPPFEAVKDSHGNIYARGSQDMKCVAMQYLEALRVLIKQGVRMQRTIHLTFVPDEEIGGHDGMEKFVDSQVFKDLNVGCALDEGLASENDMFTVYYGERVPWWIQVKCEGTPGHGSRFLKDTAMERLVGVINRFLKFRAEQEAILNSDKSLRLGDVTSVNLTMLEGGIQFNVVPAVATAGFDMRVAPSVDLQEMKKAVDEWTAGDGISYTFKQVYWTNPVTDISAKNTFWTAFTRACAECKMEIQPEIFPAATDSRYIRCAGLPAIGFSPMNNTPILLHDNNEYLNERIFLRGIELYAHIIPQLANQL